MSHAQKSIVDASTQKNPIRNSGRQLHVSNISAVEDVNTFIGYPIKCLRIRVRLVLSSHE